VRLAKQLRIACLHLAHRHCEPKNSRLRLASRPSSTEHLCCYRRLANLVTHDSTLNVYAYIFFLFYGLWNAYIGRKIA